MHIVAFPFDVKRTMDGWVLHRSIWDDEIAHLCVAARWERKRKYPAAVLSEKVTCSSPRDPDWPNGIDLDILWRSGTGAAVAPSYWTSQRLQTRKVFLYKPLYFFIVFGESLDSSLGFVVLFWLRRPSKLLWQKQMPRYGSALYSRRPLLIPWEFRSTCRFVQNSQLSCIRAPLCPKH
jgi:hypothetical protein